MIVEGTTCCILEIVSHAANTVYVPWRNSCLPGQTLAPTVRSIVGPGAVAQSLPWIFGLPTLSIRDGQRQC